jgi:hypothetical protein
MLSLLATDPPSTVTRVLAAVVCLAAGSLLVWNRSAIARGRWSVPVLSRATSDGQVRFRTWTAAVVGTGFILFGLLLLVP